MVRVKKNCRTFAKEEMETETVETTLGVVEKSGVKGSAKKAIKTKMIGEI